ncbi:hypothetical protein V1512DRAFT_264234 [Lipomyces arxii]|uniref:uncharacterized protein n=1 Tax=Lipomyces arxii TaxID=56418 RepID=UPI0034CFCD08
MPLVEEIHTGRTSSAVSTGRRKGPVRTADSAAVQRAISRRLAELERENYNDTVKIDIPNPRSEGRSVGKTAGVRKILTSKKVLSNMFDEDDAAAREYSAAAVGPSVYPARHLCSVCGYWGFVTCIRCGARYCSLACEDTHRETRCLKVYA